MTQVARLIRTARADLRCFTGSIMDWSSYDNDGIWLSGKEPTWSRTTDDLVGLEYSLGDAIECPISLAGAFAVEIAFKPRTPFGFSGADGYLISSDPQIPPIYGYVSSATGRLSLDCNGVPLQSATGVIKDQVPAHVIFSRDTFENGQIFYNGVEVANGHVGDGVANTMYVGNGLLLLNRAFNGAIYLARVWRKNITTEEASLLYAASRPLIRPGAHKSSGIISPIG